MLNPEKLFHSNIWSVNEDRDNLHRRGFASFHGAKEVSVRVHTYLKMHCTTDKHSHR